MAEEKIENKYLKAVRSDELSSLYDEQLVRDILKENEIELKSFFVKQLLEYYGIK